MGWVVVQSPSSALEVRRRGVGGSVRLSRRLAGWLGSCVVGRVRLPARVLFGWLWFGGVLV